MTPRMAPGRAPATDVAHPSAARISSTLRSVVTWIY